MKNLTLRSCAVLALLAVLSACSADCHCPTCPVAANPPTTTIIHDRPPVVHDEYPY